jgi:hypothetical protein
MPTSRLSDAQRPGCQCWRCHDRDCPSSCRTRHRCQRAVLPRWAHRVSGSVSEVRLARPASPWPSPPSPSAAVTCSALVRDIVGAMGPSEFARRLSAPQSENRDSTMPSNINVWQGCFRQPQAPYRAQAMPGADGARPIGPGSLGAVFGRAPNLQRGCEIASRWHSSEEDGWPWRLSSRSPVQARSARLQGLRRSMCGHGARPPPASPRRTSRHARTTMLTSSSRRSHRSRGSSTPPRSAPNSRISRAASSNP